MKANDRPRYLYDYKIKGDKNALGKLIMTYVPYIESVISKYKDSYYDLDELRSVGLESVLNSIITYPNSTTLNLLNTRVSNHLNFDILNYVKENNLLESYEIYSLQHKNDEEYSYNMVSELLDSNLEEELIKAFDVLKPIEKRILEMKFGFNGKRKMTLMEIAIELSCSFQYIGSIYKRALNKIYLSHSDNLVKFL